MSVSFFAFAIAPTGIDVGAGITAAIALLAGVVTVAIGGYAAFLIVRKGLRWLNQTLSEDLRATALRDAPWDDSPDLTLDEYRAAHWHDGEWKKTGPDQPLPF